VRSCGPSEWVPTVKKELLEADTHSRVLCIAAGEINPSTRYSLFSPSAGYNSSYSARDQESSYPTFELTADQKTLHRDSCARVCNTEEETSEDVISANNCICECKE
jgi:hypothetical protein